MKYLITPIIDSGFFLIPRAQSRLKVHVLYVQLLVVSLSESGVIDVNCASFK